MEKLAKNGELEDFDEALFQAKMLCWSEVYADLNKVDNLLDQAAESGEKYYLKAVVSLRRDNYNITGCNNAISFLEKSLEHDPVNKLYRSLFNAIKDEIKIYNDKQEKTRKAQEARERRIKEEVERKKRKETIGNAVGIGASIAGFICVCACCNECCSGGCC